jgi:DNA-binding NarL/FixJ family response regulator
MIFSTGGVFKKSLTFFENSPSERNFEDIMLSLLTIWIVEDNLALSRALKIGLEANGALSVIAQFPRGEDALAQAGTAEMPNVVLMDVALAGEMNGIQVATALRREYPRLPVVFYSIQDDEAYYRAFLRSGIVSHYAYVRKSNYLLPESIIPLLRNAAAGSSFIDPEIEARVQDVRHKDAHDPMTLLESNEQVVVTFLAQGLTNEQIAARLGYIDARAVSRTNGQIYTAWGLNSSTTDEKVARTRAALIYQRRELIIWDEEGAARIMGTDGIWREL